MKSSALHLMIATAATFTLATTAVAQETPNIQPGMWKYDNTISVDAEYPFPEQTHSNEECVTIEDVERGDAFLEDVEECEILDSNITSDRMTYTMRCQSADGMDMTMEADMEFHGDSAAGTITGDMQSPMGPMSMRIEMEGTRIGDC